MKRWIIRHAVNLLDRQDAAKLKVNDLVIGWHNAGIRIGLLDDISANKQGAYCVYMGSNRCSRFHYVARVTTWAAFVFVLFSQPRNLGKLFEVLADQREDV